MIGCDYALEKASYATCPRDAHGLTGKRCRDCPEVGMIVLEGFVSFPERNAPEGDWALGPWIGGDRVIERLESLKLRDYTVTLTGGQVFAEASGVLWVREGDHEGAPEVRVERTGREPQPDVDVLEVLRAVDGQRVLMRVTVAEGDRP